MAYLEHEDGGRHRLWPSTRVGRAPDADLVLEEPRASRDHALVWWGPRGWSVRDLGGKNGTSVDGRLLKPGEERLLAVGMRVVFGGPVATFVAADLGAPGACAVSGADVVEAWSGLLVLPGDAVIAQGSDGLWRYEDRVVSDREALQVGERVWALRLPVPVPPTEQAEPDRRRNRDGPLADLPPPVELELLGAEERPRLVVREAEAVFDLGARAHHRVVAALVHERRHARRRGVAEPEAGWLTIADVAAWLGSSTQQTYVLLWRLREQLDREGPVPADRLVERRATGEIRLADVPIR